MLMTKIARELINMSEDLRSRHPAGTNFDNGELYDFDQVWASTALGFGGIGGSAMTIARTYVFIPALDPFSDYKQDGKAFVYFGGRFAYECDTNDRFWEDVATHRMASVQESGRYKKRKDNDGT